MFNGSAAEYKRAFMKKKKILFLFEKNVSYFSSCSFITLHGAIWRAEEKRKENRAVTIYP